MPPKRAGRPVKYLTDEERKAARAAASRRHYQQQKGLPDLHQPQELVIRPDPLSILHQAGLEGFGATTTLSSGIQTEDLAIPLDPALEVIHSPQPMPPLTYHRDLLFPLLRIQTTTLFFLLTTMLI